MLRATTLRSFLVLSATFLAVCLLGGCVGAYVGGVDRVVAQADRSDPVRAAVVAALQSVDQNFEPILGAPLSESEREEMIQGIVKMKGLGQGQSSMDLLRAAESMAETARHVTAEMPGASGVYYNQEIATGSVRGHTESIEWQFPVDFADRKEVTSDLIARIAPLFAVDPKWLRSGTLDPELNPIMATTTFGVFTKIAVGGGSSELLMVSIDYWHDPENFEGRSGVRVYISKLSTRVI